MAKTPTGSENSSSTREHGIPPKSNRTKSIASVPTSTKPRNLVERFCNRIKQSRRIATRYDKLVAK